MRDLLSSRTRGLRVRLPDCYGRGNYDCGRLVNSSRIRCRMRLAAPMELTSRRVGTWADMFCRETCKRLSSSQSLTAPDDYRDICKHDLHASQTFAAQRAN